MSAAEFGEWAAFLDLEREDANTASELSRRGGTKPVTLTGETDDQATAYARAILGG